MAEELTGNVLVAQSGGPTAVINASLAGVIEESLNHGCIEEIYGGLNGVLGILQERFIDLAEEPQQAIRGLRFTPASALGTCRFKLRKDADLHRVVEVFKAHNIRYFFYIGGNDSQDTADRISKLAAAEGWEMRVIGIPKTVDNDLTVTDHTPGYGSVIKHVATTVRELACDAEAMGQHDLVYILEVMGRSAGWIAAGASLAKRRDHPEDPPHLVYLPEVPFDLNKFLDDITEVLKQQKYCLIVVGEGLVDGNGNYVATADGSSDSFGHSQLGGAGDYLKSLIDQHFSGVKTRSFRPGHSQRAAAANASLTDVNEAYLAGQAAVRAALNGETDKMVTLFRGDGDAYTCETSLADLSEVANGVKHLPANWINEDGTSLSYQFVKYASPLIQGEVDIPHEHGLPQFVKLGKVSVAPLLQPYEVS
ncbi:MAG: diphosphate--fructose-6-phosphate 1-phosphotransferase [Verrucomicrobia bacterium]|jgi:6-phosphofructokinase 1|nr:diphosphate--fructose-6-phosphate 1-phosphotransferase [Verrucomicrobiota bacterium]